MVPPGPRSGQAAHLRTAPKGSFADSQRHWWHGFFQAKGTLDFLQRPAALRQAEANAARVVTAVESILAHDAPGHHGVTRLLIAQRLRDVPAASRARSRCVERAYHKFIMDELTRLMARYPAHDMRLDPERLQEPAAACLMAERFVPCSSPHGLGHGDAESDADATSVTTPSGLIHQFPQVLRNTAYSSAFIRANPTVLRSLMSMSEDLPEHVRPDAAAAAFVVAVRGGLAWRRRRHVVAARERALAGED